MKERKKERKNEVNASLFKSNAKRVPFATSMVLPGWNSLLVIYEQGRLPIRTIPNHSANNRALSLFLSFELHGLRVTQGPRALCVCGSRRAFCVYVCGLPVRHLRQEQRFVVPLSLVLLRECSTSNVTPFLLRVLLWCLFFFVVVVLSTSALTEDASTGEGALGVLMLLDGQVVAVRWLPSGGCRCPSS